MFCGPSLCRNICCAETMGVLILINAPAIFTAAWAIIKTLLNERMQSKVACFSLDSRTPFMFRACVSMFKFVACEHNHR